MKIGDKVFFVLDGRNIDAPELRKGIISKSRPKWVCADNPWMVKNANNKIRYAPSLKRIFPRTEDGLKKAKIQLQESFLKRHEFMLRVLSNWNSFMAKGLRMKI